MVSTKLLCLLLCKKYNCNCIKIQKVLDDYSESNQISQRIAWMINHNNLKNEKILNELFEYFRTVDFLYDNFSNSLPLKKLYSVKQKDNLPDLISQIPNINNDFYNGFGYDLIHSI